jgi:hypothetical protein
MIILPWVLAMRQLVFRADHAVFSWPVALVEKLEVSTRLVLPAKRSAEPEFIKSLGYWQPTFVGLNNLHCVIEINALFNTLLVPSPAPLSHNTRPNFMMS